MYYQNAKAIVAVEIKLYFAFKSQSKVSVSENVINFDQKKDVREKKIKLRKRMCHLAYSIV